jgi:hypothetical protein
MYSQPQKKLARKKALEHAIEVLTTRRCNAAVVPKNYVTKVRSELMAAKSGRDSDSFVARYCTDELCDLWESFWLSKIGAKSASELVVAYLAGPEPLNDFNELIRLGVHPHNIFAFESDTKVFNDRCETWSE